MSDFETVPVGTMERLAQVAAERTLFRTCVCIFCDTPN